MTMDDKDKTIYDLGIKNEELVKERDEAIAAREAIREFGQVKDSIIKELQEQLAKANDRANSLEAQLRHKGAW
jgi:bacterioferritin (cytochrome b1)